jgi:hypothetical protein
MLRNLLNRGYITTDTYYRIISGIGTKKDWIDVTKAEMEYNKIYYKER